MPSRKHRRRREKLQRHEYEYVVETDEGEEIVERPAEREKRNGDKRGDKRDKPARRGRTREVPKPSMQRVLKRTAIFLPLALVMVFLLGKSLSTQQKISQAALLLAFFIPFSYVVDVFMYRAYQRRQAKRGGGPTKR